jgi:hypothetical protein
VDWSEQEQRNIWTVAGGLLFAVGLTVGATWVAARGGSHHGDYVSVLGGVALGCVLIGPYTFAAALTDTKWLWLPGKSAIRQRRIGRKELDSLRTQAIFTLTMAYLMGLQCDDDFAACRDWLTDVQHFVSDVWGPHRAVVIAGLIVQGSQEKHPQIQEAVSEVLAHVVGLLIDAPQLPIQEDVKPTQVSYWLKRFRPDDQQQTIASPGPPEGQL